MLNSPKNPSAAKNWLKLLEHWATSALSKDSHPARALAAASSTARSELAALPGTATQPWGPRQNPGTATEARGPRQSPGDRDRVPWTARAPEQRQRHRPGPTARRPLPSPPARLPYRLRAGEGRRGIQQQPQGRGRPGQQQQELQEEHKQRRPRSRHRHRSAAGASGLGPGGAAPEEGPGPGLGWAGSAERLRPARDSAGCALRLGLKKQTDLELGVAFPFVGRREGAEVCVLGRDHWSSSVPTPLSQHSHLERVTQERFLGMSSERDTPLPPWAPVPGLCHHGPKKSSSSC